MASPSPPAGAVLQGRRDSSVVSPVRQVRSRTHSISSDRPSTIASHGLLSPPTAVSPEAAFIASSAASQIVTNDHDAHADTWYDQYGIEPAGETAFVAPAALTLVNNFLDQLLYSFLQVSKATTLSGLRPAVSDVLKPKLAKDAINNADEELREYLGGAEEDDYAQSQGKRTSRDWDVELVWKRTRLRCMVYSSLGDMEEEDEDLWMEQENLEIAADEKASHSISPAVAIFLTSVLEYMGELTLTVAGQAAYNKMRSRMEKDLKDGTRMPGDVADRIIVDELDMERVALDRTLGRLWRGWKKRIRTPNIDALGRQVSMRSLRKHMRSESSDSIGLRGEHVGDGRGTDHLGLAIAEDVQPSDIPLPMRDRDVDEIEVPGLVSYSDDDEDVQEETGADKRPLSMHLPDRSFGNNITDGEPNILSQKHKRGVSLPSAHWNPYFPRVDTAAEEPAPSYTQEESKESRDDDVQDEQAAQPGTGATAQETIVGDGTGVAFTSDVVSPSESTPSMPTPGIAVSANVSPLEPEPAQQSEPAEEEVHYEKATVMTTSRFSFNGSKSPSVSDFDSGRLERTSSLRSARIVSVSGPKGSSSRPVSIDAKRSNSTSAASSTSSAFVPEEAVPSEPVMALPSTFSPHSKARPSPYSTVTISESDEEMDFFPPELQGVPPRTNMSGRHPYASASRQYTSRQETTSGSTQFESIPEIPARAPRHGSRQQQHRQNSYDRPSPMESDQPPPSSTEAERPTQPTHASSSSISSNTSRLKAVRTSEDGYANRADSVARDFEDLIQSNQTITYTLTPENMRDPNGSGSPVLQTKMGRMSEDSRLPGRSGSSQAPSDMHQSPPSHRATAATPSAPDHGLSGTQGAMARKAVAAQQARDARVPAESTADFADFIKSTGPPGDTRPAPMRPVVPPKTGSEVRRPTSNGTTTSNRARYQPRDATVNEQGDNSDLIDFIRQGPPSSVSGQHRIPRHVAPFRNTMDSDQMAGANGGRAVDATIPEIRHSHASTNITDNSGPSIHSSVNSSSALLKKKPTQPTIPSNNMFDEEDMMPKRKQRRVRDPYALDFSDEEDEDDELFNPTPRPPVKQEESLADFLRNCEPPPAPPSASEIEQPKKKRSTASLMARFRNRGDSGSAKANSKPSATSDGARPPTRTHVPLQVSMPSGYDKYGPVDTGSTSPPPGIARSQPRMTAAGSAGTGRVPMKKFEPREAASGTSATSDLAAFLRDSEPPPDAAGPRSHSPVEEESSGISKMFGRRKKLGMA